MSGVLWLKLRLNSEAQAEINPTHIEVFNCNEQKVANNSNVGIKGLCNVDTDDSKLTW